MNVFTALPPSPTALSCEYNYNLSPGSHHFSQTSSAVGSMIRRSFSIGRVNERLVRNMLAHRSPTVATRSGIVRSVNVRGPTAAVSISSHVQGADTGAPGFARTV